MDNNLREKQVYLTEKGIKKDKNYNVPQNTTTTVIRLAKLLKPQRVRLCIIGTFIILYTILTIYTPFKSAQVVDSIWQNIQTARNQGVAFSIA